MTKSTNLTSVVYCLCIWSSSCLIPSVSAWSFRSSPLSSSPSSSSNAAVGVLASTTVALKTEGATGEVAVPSSSSTTSTKTAVDVAESSVENSNNRTSAPLSTEQLLLTLKTVSKRASRSVVSSVSSCISTSSKVITSTEAQIVTATFVGAVLTFVLNNKTPLSSTTVSPIVSSSVIGLISALALPLRNNQLSIAAFCGSFAGMARLTVIPTVWPEGLILGLVCAAILRLFDSRKWLIGKGGRLGFIAQCACTLQFIVSSLIRPVTSGAALISGKNNIIQLPPITKLVSSLAASIVFTVGGALLMTVWKEYMTELSDTKNDGKENFVVDSNDIASVVSSSSTGSNQLLEVLYQRLSSSVAASSVTGLLSAAILPASMAGPVFCGSFVAMSSPDQLKTYGSMIASSALAGMCQVAMSGVLLGGWGGKLGTAALLGVSSYKGIQRATHHFQKQRSSDEAAPTVSMLSTPPATSDLSVRK